MIPIISTGYPQIVIPLINNAKTNIDIIMYHWGYYSNQGQSQIQKLNYAIKSAITRGVSVRVLLHPGAPSDHLRAINARTAALLQTNGASIKWGSRSGVIHAKIVLIDKSLAIIGSHNFSHRSMSSNVEIGVVVEGAGEIRKFQEYFDILWGQS